MSGQSENARQPEGKTPDFWRLAALKEQIERVDLQMRLLQMQKADLSADLKQRLTDAGVDTDQTITFDYDTERVVGAGRG